METTFTSSRNQVLAFAFALLAFTGSAWADNGGGSSMPSGILWPTVIAFVVGFLLGSAPSESSGADFDGQGAVFGGLVAAFIVGGVAHVLTTQALTPGLYFAGLGVALVLVRKFSRRAHRVPRSIYLEDGINRAQGESLKEKAKQARKMFLDASFQADQFGGHATRSRLTWDYGRSGAQPSDLVLIKQGVELAYPDTFAILVLLVSTVPGEQDQPGVVVVREVQNLKKLEFAIDSVTTGDGIKIPASTILSSVGYAWR